MRSLVGAVANVVLFIVTPVALVWVQSRLAMATETLGKLPMEKKDCLRGLRATDHSAELFLL
jgi:hypothetical protein